MNRRRQLYKSPMLISPPTWKDVYRKKCFERLRASRASLIEKFRFSESPSKLLQEATSPSKLVSDVMEIEWNAINHNRSFPSLSKMPHSSGEEDWEETLMKETLKEIQQELQNEDETRLNEFLRLDGGELEAKVDMFLSDEVICPVCQKGKLKEDKACTFAMSTAFQTPPRPPGPNSTSVVKCDCGLLISSSSLTCTLSKIRSALQHTLSDHEKNCVSTLSFTATEDNAGTNVLVTCPACEWITFLL